MTEAQIHKFIFAPGFSTAAAVTSVSGRGVGMDVVRTNIDQIGGTIDVKSVAGAGLQRHRQDSADAGDRLGADRGSRRRSLCDPATGGGRTGAGAGQFRAPHRAHQGHRGIAPAQQAVAADASEEAAQDRRRHLQRSGKRLHRGDPGRQPDLRHRGRRRVPHRGNRGQADVDQAASHRDVLRQHHSGRRRRDHDHRSQRHRQGARDLGRSQPRNRRRERGDARRRRRAIDLAAGVPRRLARSPRRCRWRW